MDTNEHEWKRENRGYVGRAEANKERRFSIADLRKRAIFKSPLLVADARATEND